MNIQQVGFENHLLSQLFHDFLLILDITKNTYKTLQLFVLDIYNMLYISNSTSEIIMFTFFGKVSNFTII